MEKIYILKVLLVSRSFWFGPKSVGMNGKSGGRIKIYETESYFLRHFFFIMVMGM